MKYKTFYRSSDGKAILENFISLSTLQFASMLFPLFTLPYVLRVIGFEYYGIITLAVSLVTYFQSVTDYSFQITATRDVAKFRDSPDKLNVIFSTVLTIKALFLLLAIVIISLVVFIYPPFLREWEVYFFTALMLIGYILFPDWFFQGIEKMKYITILNLGIKLFFTVCIFLFIKDKEDYWIYPLLYSSGYILAGIVGQYILLRNYKIRFVRLKRKYVKLVIIRNFPIFVNQFTPNLYNNSNTFLLGFFVANHLVGVYAAIKKIVDFAVMFLRITSRVFFPMLTRKGDAFNLYKKLMTLMTGLLILAMIFANKFIFWYLNISISESFTVLVVLSLGMIGVALYNIWGLNYFIRKREDKLVMRNTIWSSIIGLLTSFPLIYYFGIFGAAINLSLSRWLMGGGLLYVYLKKRNESWHSS